MNETQTQTRFYGYEVKDLKPPANKIMAGLNKLLPAAEGQAPLTFLNVWGNLRACSLLLVMDRETEEPVACAFAEAVHGPRERQLYLSTYKIGELRRPERDEIQGLLEEQVANIYKRLEAKSALTICDTPFDRTILIEAGWHKQHSNSYVMVRTYSS